MKVRHGMSKDIDGLRVTDAEQKLQPLEEIDRLILDLRAERIKGFVVGGPTATEIVITDY
ncbi:protein of unknown function [Burkholderia multivorans]